MRAALALLVLASCAGAPPPPPPRPSGPDVQTVNRAGEDVELAAILVPGKVTVVDFYADWCGACTVAQDKLMPTLREEPRIALRKVNVGEWDSPVAKRYDVGVMPHLRVFAPDGTMKFVLIGRRAMEAGEVARSLLP